MKEPGSDINKVRYKALEYLARREYGVNELGRKLVQRGFDEDITFEVVKELASKNLVSDFRFIMSGLGQLRSCLLAPRVVGCQGSSRRNPTKADVPPMNFGYRGYCCRGRWRA